MADHTTSRKNKSIILPILAGIFLVTLLGMFFLPSLISTDWGGSKAKQAINSRIPGKIDFEKLSLSWFKGIQCQGISYDNRAEGFLVNVADITTSKGLLAIAINYKEMGAVTINDPVVYVYLDEKATPAKTDVNTSQKKQATSKPQAAKKEGNSRSMLFPVFDGQLIITDGSVIAVSPDTKEKSVLQDLDLQLKIVGLENLLDYLVTFQSGDGTGQVKGEGTVTLPVGDISKLDEIQSQAALDIDNWEIKDLLSILATTANIPTGSGQLNGHMDISGSTKKGLKIKGNLTGQQLNLQGGPLKADTPSLERVNVEVDAEKTASIFTLNRLALVSPLATGNISGTFGTQNTKQIDGQLVVDLAQVFAQFPSTLNLKEGLKVSEGKIDVNAKIRATDKASFFDGSVRLDQLRGVADKKKIALDKPVTLVAKGEQNPEGFRLENFAVQSSFLNGNGQGDINHMQVQLIADIDAALSEIEKFIQLEGWKSSGKMELNLQVDSKTESLRTLAGDVSVNDFVLQQKGRVIAPGGAFKANLASDLRLDQDMRPQEILDTLLDFQSWIGSGAVTVKNLLPASEQNSAVVKDLGFKGAFDLNYVSALLQTLDVLPKDIRFSGKADIDTRLSLKDDKLELGETTLDTKDFLLQKAKQKFSEKKIHLTTRGFANLKEKSVTLKPIDLKTTTGQIVFPELIVTDWSQLEKSIKTHGNINQDLGLVTTLLADVLKLQPDTTIAGQAAIKVNIDLIDTKQQFVQLDGTIGSVKISSKNKVLLSEDAIRLAMDLKGDVGDQNFTLSKLEFSTQPLTISATGKVAPDKKERMLTTEGSMTLDLKALSRYLKSLADLELEMTGAAKRPFSIKAKSVNGQWVEIPKHAELSTSFSAESIRGFGLSIQSLEVPIRLANSLGEVSIQGTVNRGKMALKSAIDFTVDSPVITIPENSTILTGVGITEDMSNDLLAKIHPIFKGAAVSQGTVGLGMRNFSWPLDAAVRKDAAFVGTLTFNDVKLQAGGLLAPLLAVMKVDERDIALSDQPIEFVGENDRIRCSPLEIKIKEYSLMLSGSVGFDQSLDYIAQVPVTRKMVGGDVYKYLEGTFISVPISGTVSKPVISKNLVQVALKDLIIQAGKKQISDQAGKLLQNLFK